MTTTTTAQALQQIAEPTTILTEHDAILLNQAIEMLEEHSAEQRRRGNCSAAEAAECSAHAVQRLGVAMLAAHRGAQPAPAAHADADTLARTETTARYLLGWKYGQMPTSPDTLLRQSPHAKAQWAWNAACKLLQFIDGSAPDEVQAVATEPMGPAVPATQAVASIYVTEGGDREFDDWKMQLPVGRNLLYPHPAPTAQEAQRYRLLKRGEAIEAADEFLWDDFSWRIDPKGIFCGEPWGYALRAARRAIAAQAAQEAGSHG